MTPVPSPTPTIGAPRPPATPPRLPMILLGLMTMVTVLGPVAIGLSLRGGPSAVWPPDRPVEWFVLLGTSSLVVCLMISCSVLSLLNQRTMKGKDDAPLPREARL